MIFVRVDEWANNIGSDIWDTGKKITKKYELEQVCFIFIVHYLY